MDALGLNRYCCRRMLMVRSLLAAVAARGAAATADSLASRFASSVQTHVDLIEKLLNYNTLERQPQQQGQPPQQQQLMQE